VAEISVIVVSYRTPELLRGCLEMLAADPGRRSRETLVVDNASGDESPAVARSVPGVRLLEIPENLGFGGGANRGMAAATGGYLFIMNPDVEVLPGALDMLADFLDAHPETGIVAPKLLNTDGSLQYSCRRHYTLKTILLRRTILGRMFPEDAALRRHLMMDYDHAAPRAVDWVAGAAMMVRREALEDVGPMEEHYFLYFEDVDWCTRMQTRGWRVHYVPDAVMVHHWQRASRGFGPAARRHLRSGLRFYDRWGGLVYVLRQNREALQRTGLVLLDLAAFAAAFLTAYLVRQELAFALHKPLWALRFYGGFFAASVLLFTAAFHREGLYRTVKEGDWVDTAFRVGKAATLASVILMASTFILDMRGYSRLIVLSSWPLVVAFAFGVRLLLDTLFTRAHRERWNLRRIALVGAGPLMDHLAAVLREHPELGWDPLRIRLRAGQDGPESTPLRGLATQLAAERVSVVVVAPESLGVTEEALPTLVMPLRQAGFGVRLASPFLASLPPQARVESVADVAWLSLDRPALRPDSLSKRAIDVAVAAAYALVGAIPLALWALGRKLSGKPVLEPREAWRGRWGERQGGRRLAGGGWLRLYPLLGLVVKGDLSLVGLRPLKPGEETPGGEEWQRVREHYRPGLLGPWTLTGSLAPQDEMRQELRYLEAWSPEIDLKVIVRALLVRARAGKGASPTPAPGVTAPSGGGGPEPAASSGGRARGIGA
jgi:hypothetical protein